MNTLKEMEGRQGEAWYYTNRGSVEIYIAPVNGRAATMSFRITRARLQKILAEMEKL